MVDERYQGDIIFLCAVVALCGLSLIATDAALHPDRRPLLVADQVRTRNAAQQEHAEFREVEITAKDGAILRAWILRPTKRNGNAVILFHGVTDNRLSMTGYGEMFLRHGYDVLMPDAWAHGTSGGQRATYGLYEADDMHRWFDWISADQHPACIYGFAESIGAAGLLQSLGTESRFCAVAAESPFSSFREVSYDRLGQFFHAGPWVGRTVLRPVVDCSFVYAKWKYKLDFNQVSPARVVAATKVPVLLIHGKVDQNIPIRHSRKIAAGNAAVILWEVPDAGHCGAIGAAPEEFERRVIRWFETYQRGGANKKVALASVAAL